MSSTPRTTTGSEIRLTRVADASPGRSGSLGYSMWVLGAWSLPLALGLALAAWQWLIVEFAPFVFVAAAMLAIGFGLLVMWTGRRAAMRVLGAFDSTPDHLAWVLVPPGLRLWKAAGGRGSGGVVNEWVLLVRHDECLMARGSSLAQVRHVSVDVQPDDIVGNPTVMRLSCADRSAMVRLHWSHRRDD